MQNFLLTKMGFWVYFNPIFIWHKCHIYAEESYHSSISAPQMLIFQMLPYINYNYMMPNIHLEIMNLYFIILMFPNLTFDKIELNCLDT